MMETPSIRQRYIEEFAARHSMGADAVETLLRSVASGGGTMAQFSHPELGGMGQWTRGGMIMVSDMFNNALKYRVDALCTEISDALAKDPSLGLEPRPAGSGTGFPSFGPWWPAEFGSPSSSGAQNDLRYAFFPGARRLVIEKAGEQAVYDTGEHMISGVSQQQGGDQTLSLSSQLGTVSLATLPRIYRERPESAAPGTSLWEAGVEEAASPDVGSGAPETEPESATETATLIAATSPEPASAPPAMAAPIPHSADDIFATLERLAGLKAKGILTDEEFAAKKAELLGRL